MSSYATLDDVQAFIPQWRVDGTTRPSATEVSTFITRISARLDSIAAAQGYLTPVSGADSLDILKSICLAGSAWYVGRTLFPQDSTIWIDYANEYRDMIQALSKGELALNDAPSSSDDFPLTVLDGSIDNATASSMVPFFTRQMQF